MILKHRDKELLRFEWIGDARVRNLRRVVLSGFLQKRASDIVRFGRKADRKVEQSLVAEAIFSSENVGVKSPGPSVLSSSEQRAAQLILRNSSVTAEELANQLGLTVRQVQRVISALKRKAGLQRRGSDKSGEWYFPQGCF